MSDMPSTGGPPAGEGTRTQHERDAQVTPAVAVSVRLHREGIRAFCEGDHAEALRLLRQAALLSPGNLEILKDVGHAHLHRGEPAQAHEAYRRAWDQGARFVDLAYNLALLCLEQRQPAEAARLLRSAADQEFTVEPGRYYLGLFFPSNSVFLAECCLQLGIAARDRGLTEGALEHLQRAVDLNPRLLGAHQLMAECLAAERRWDRAIEKCREILDERPAGEELAGTRLTLANALVATGHPHEAARELRVVLEVEPEHVEAQALLRRIEEQVGESLHPKRGAPVPTTEVASPLFGLTRTEPLTPGLEETELAIVGQSSAMRRVMRYARLAAASNATVLLTGENGTGKELIARAIYLYSPRRAGPMIAVNCAALPETLLESELFGHELGAFTGAHAQKKGRFELADGGTLFLDEVGEMSIALQVKLLRVLQEKEFTRVGGTETIRVDVRIIAATNQNLERLIDEGRFRKDLYFRLNVIPIQIPPLRERREDILLLAEHFMRRCAGRGIAATLTPEEMEIVTSHSWPGNVRELENFIERAVVMGHSGQQLIEEIHSLRRREAPTRGADGEPGFQVHTDLTLGELERAYILHVLDRTEGNQRRAAEVLGIDPSTLWRKMKRYQASTDSQPRPTVSG